MLLCGSETCLTAQLPLQHKVNFIFCRSVSLIRKEIEFVHSKVLLIVKTVSLWTENKKLYLLQVCLDPNLILEVLKTKSYCFFQIELQQVNL